MVATEDLRALREYVTAPSSGSQQQADSTVVLHVTHSNLKLQMMELRFDLHMSVRGLKEKLSTHCGTNPDAMELRLLDNVSQAPVLLRDDHRLLGYYSPHDGQTLHIVDLDPHSLSANGWLEDTSKVEKYVMSEEAYAKRENTYKKYKEQKQKEDPEWTAEKELCQRRGIPYVKPEPKKVSSEDEFAEEAELLEVGQRCECTPAGRRGTIRYIGKVEGLPAGYWVGVEYDEPLGKNDGSIKGKRYFQCSQSYGGFVRPDKVEMGDFPAIDGLDDEDEL